MTLEPRESLPLPRRPLPLLAVAAGRLLVTLSPQRMERVLRRLARGARPATTAEALRARTEVVAVSRRAAGQYCLERSVATAVLTRARGSWPEWVSGVCLVPFAAHAWVEAEGRPVGERMRLDAFQKNIVVPCGQRRADRPSGADHPSGADRPSGKEE